MTTLQAVAFGAMLAWISIAYYPGGFAMGCSRA